MVLSQRQFLFFKHYLIKKSDGLIQDLLYYSIYENVENGNKFCNLFVDMNSYDYNSLKEQLLFDTTKVLSYLLGDLDIKQVNFRVVNADIYKR